MERDPVCGMEVSPAEAAYRLEHEGKHYLFCSAACRAEFLRHPDKYTGRNLREAMVEEEGQG